MNPSTMSPSNDPTKNLPSSPPTMSTSVSTFLPAFEPSVQTLELPSKFTFKPSTVRTEAFIICFSFQNKF